ncbi:MAG: zf-HC2 domain-containing protein [Desulfosarcina sp.]
MKRLCVDEETLMDYIEGRLPPRLRKRVEKHLCKCANCRDLLMVATELMHDNASIHVEPVPSTVTDRAVAAVQALSGRRHTWRERLLSGGRLLLDSWRSLLPEAAPDPLFQPVGLRGACLAEDENLVRDCIDGAGFAATLTIERISDTHFNVQVEPTLEPLAGPALRVALFTDGREIASATLLMEAVQFEDLPRGKYTLVFTRANQQLDTYPFEV